MWHDQRGCWYLGRGRKSAVFLHISVAALVLAGFYFVWLANRWDGVSERSWLSLAAWLTIVWGLSVALHDLSQLLAAHFVGADVSEIVFGPFGNLRPPVVDRNVRAELLVASVGVIVQLMLCLVAAVCLMLLRSSSQIPAQLFHPFQTGLVAPGVTHHEFVLRLCFWCNWCLLILNLLPVWPADGVRIYQAGLLSIFPDLSRRSAAVRVAIGARRLSIGLLFAAWVFRHDGIGSLLPTWMPLVLLALLLHLQSKIRIETPQRVLTWKHDPSKPPARKPTKAEVSVDRATTTETNHLVSELTLDSIADSNPDLEKNEQSQPRDQLQENRQVDQVLRRLHNVGLDQLTASEREVLQRASQRLREEKRTRSSQGK